MHQRGHQRQLPPSPSRASAQSPSHRHSPGALLAVVALLSAGVVGGVGCGDEDTTDVVPVGGSGGSAGSAGSAGRGGTAGTAGTAGTGGTAGTAGTAGTGGAGELPDAGDAGDAPDAQVDGGDGGGGPPGPDPEQLARAEAICTNMEGVADCSPPPNCESGYLDAQASTAFFPPECTDEIIDFYQCLAEAGPGGFVCRDGIADISYSDPLLDGYSACPDEEAAWLEAQGGQGCDD